MVNLTLIWLLAIPVILGGLIFALRFSSHRECWPACAGFAVIGLLITCGLFFAAKGSKTMDTEVWSGQVVGKSRDHGTYEQPYECRCRTVQKSSGSGKDRRTWSERECDTCYETHYTVEWNCQSTVGSFQIDKLDRTSRNVYNSPDPQRYTIIQKGDPASTRRSYTNYVQAVPNSLFDPAAADVKAKFANMLPDYPDRIYDFYKVDRFVGVGWAPADAKEWSNEISMGLRTLGPTKQVNLIIVVAKTADPTYEYALRDHWEGVNKNDVVVLIGSSAYPKIDFVRVISWTKNELFKVELRDRIQAMENIDRSIVKTSLDQITKNFERRRMREFEYLDGEIDPPDWMVWTIVILLVGAAGGLWFMIPRWFGGYTYRRRF